MKKDIILSGVGGQGILSIATVIGEAATECGVNLKQAEVHGMSQRGGDVQSNLRLSNEDIIISMEPMEALRYLPYINKESWVITSSNTFINIPNYPEESKLLNELSSLSHVVQLPIEDMAKEHKIPKSANMILLGMAAPYIEILAPEQLRSAIATIFTRKGEKVVEDNLKAFDLGFKL